MLLNKECKFDDLGYMLDCSRGAVPKVDQLKKLIDILSDFGYTYLMLYTEDTYEIKGEPYFGSMRGRYSQKEIKEIDAYCIAHNMELRACIQTLAHLGRLTRHSDYSPLFEIDDILMVGEDKTYELIDKMFNALSSSFSCKHVHIGMDEAWKLGRGKYLDKHGIVPVFEIMQYHLNRVSEIAKKYGFECDIWADMIEHAYDACQDKSNYKLNIPDNVTPIAWRYWAKGKKANEEEIKKYIMLSPKKLGYAGAAHKWGGFAPANEFSFESICEEIEGCIKFKVKRYLLTAWGDGASDASLFSTLPALFYCSLKAHGLNLNRNTKAYFKKIIGISFDQYLLVDKLNRIDDNIDYSKGLNSLAFTYLYNDTLQDLFNDIEKGDIYTLYTEGAKKLKPLCRNKTYGYVFNSLYHLALVDALKGGLGKKVYEAYKSHNIEQLKECIKTNNEAIKALEKFMKVYEYQWLTENKTFGYEKQLIRLGGLHERMCYTSRILKAYVENKVDHIDELEEEHLPTKYYFRPWDKDNDECNDWEALVSGGRMRNF